MSLSSMNSIGQIVFELESGNENVDRRMDREMEKKQTNGQNYTVFELQSGNKNVDKQSDGQTNEQMEFHQF